MFTNINIIKMAFFPKLIYRLNASPNSWDFSLNMIKLFRTGEGYFIEEKQQWETDFIR